MLVHVIISNPVFSVYKPLPLKAAPKGCGCVSSSNNKDKNTGIPGISAAQNVFFVGRQITGSPCIQAIFHALIYFLHFASIPPSPRDTCEGTCQRILPFLLCTAFQSAFLNPLPGILDYMIHRLSFLDSIL